MCANSRRSWFTRVLVEIKTLIPEHKPIFSLIWMKTAWKSETNISILFMKRKQFWQFWFHVFLHWINECPIVIAALMTQIKSIIILITWTHTQVDVFFFMGEEENVSHYFSCSWHYEHKHLVNSDFPGQVQNNNKINKTK